MTGPPLPSFDDVAARVGQALASPRPEASSAGFAEWSTTRLVFTAALIESAFTRLGWSAAYVGGGVLQFHLGGEGYQTGDVDLVVAQGTGLPVPRAMLDDVMTLLGGRASGSRHWVFGTGANELLVEIPNHEIPADPDRIAVAGDLVLTMDSVEHVVAGRIVEFHNTGNADYALQAIHALRTLGDRIDRSRLESCIAAERIKDAGAILMALVARPGNISTEIIEYAHEMLRKKRPWCDLRDATCGPE